VIDPISSIVGRIVDGKTRYNALVDSGLIKPTDGAIVVGEKVYVYDNSEIDAVINNIGRVK